MKLKLAILDMYDGTPNLGLAGIVKLAEEAGNVEHEMFNVRTHAEIADLSFDAYIFSGGPGDPRETDERWSTKFFGLIDDIWNFNALNPENAKHVLFICHSFQMACDHFNIGTITERRSQSFGVFPVHLTEEGTQDEMFEALNDPFYAADFRLYQLVQPDPDRLDELGASILALEKIRPHVPLERAIMAVRFSDTCLGVQFHPEADPAGMIEHFYKKTVQEKAIEIKGQLKFAQMIEDLGDPDKLKKTYDRLIPLFLRNASAKVMEFRSAIVS